MDWDKFLFNRFLIAVPELRANKKFMRAARDNKIISDVELDGYDAAINLMYGVLGKAADAMRGENLVERILLVAPELLSTRSVDFMRSQGLLTVQQAHLLRVGLRGANKLLPGLLGAEAITARLGSVVGSTLTVDLINFWRYADQARINSIREGLLGGKNRLSSEDAVYIRAMERESIETAARMRGALAAGRIGVDTYKEAASARDVWSAMTLVFGRVLSEEMLRAAVKAGTISPSQYELIRALELLGADAWRKGVAAFKNESWQARALLISEGVLSYHMVDVLHKAGLIDDELRAILNPTLKYVRALTRDQASYFQPSRKFRVVPGESPIKTYARSAGATDRAILGLLQEAANDAKKVAARAAATQKFGGATRAAQQRIVAAELNKTTRIMWEGVGYLTIFGEREAARAGLESVNFLQSRLFKGVAAEDIRKRLEAQGRAGVDSYISRQENVLGLSKRVYGNINVSNGRVQREIQKALLRGVSARELADIASSLIKPGVPGGVSYAAMRLARTEINNAFHNTSIRYTREMPWVRGYKWNLSGSHGKPDVCNDMADRDHSGLGPGVYRKRDAPQKPHPHCLCYITTVSDDAGTFERRLRSGSYEPFTSKSNKAIFGDTGSQLVDERIASGPSDNPLPQRIYGVLKKALDVAAVADVLGVI